MGGWALELSGVIPPRAHSDLEIAVPQFEFDRLQAWLSSYDFFVIGHQGMWPADHSGGAYFDNPQTFMRAPAGVWKADIIRSQYDGDTRVPRLDRPIRRPYNDAVAHTTDGRHLLRVSDGPPRTLLSPTGLTHGSRSPADNAPADCTG